MDLVDEQHVAFVELREDRSEVAGALECGTRRDVEVDAELVRHDSGHRRLAQAGRTRKEQVVRGLAPAAGGLEDDAEVVFQLALPDELVERAGPEAHLQGELAGVGGIGGGVEQLLTHRGRLREPSRPRSSDRRQSAQRLAKHRSRIFVTVEIAHRVAHLVGPVPETRERIAHIGERAAVDRLGCVCRRSAR